MGVLLGLLTLAGLLLTVLVMIAVIKLSVIKRKSPIYIISAANIMCDCIQLILAIAYLVPSILLDSWLFKGDRENEFVQFLGAVFLFCWYYGSVAQILMAVNRQVHYEYDKFSFDHVFLSYSYTAKKDIPNYSNTYIDLPLNSTSSAICAVCYAYIILYVWKMNHLYASDQSGNGRRIKEYKYALQFCAISLFYLAGWVTFRVFPVLIGASRVECFIVISICVTINSSANAFVYITSNSEVQGALPFTKASLSRISAMSGTQHSSSYVRRHLHGKS
ncbi:hypothetical protein OESDEN_01633 [Oesophagostomum dentatum]|uniref:7TM GPCR serpentine receptor class x (Srx) domain-containing protein n=1 Tax=Oesophagostomum dentatum TaxID=61180 RepID=A0A0B1TLE2_OESDE|nr:hypothetical protein OESDEN_01633 [Oesophagostomum dentatum]